MTTCENRVVIFKCEGMGLVLQKRSEEDERNLIVTITEQGMHLHEGGGDDLENAGSIDFIKILDL